MMICPPPVCDRGSMFYLLQSTSYTQKVIHVHIYIAQIVPADQHIFIVNRKLCYGKLYNNRQK